MKLPGTSPCVLCGHWCRKVGEAAFKYGSAQMYMCERCNEITYVVYDGKMLTQEQFMTWFQENVPKDGDDDE